MSTGKESEPFPIPAGDFILDEAIDNTGCFSVVYKAHLEDPQNTRWKDIGKKHVAIKKERGHPDPELRALNQESEKNAAMLLPRHEGLIKIYGTFEHDDKLHIVMGLEHGEDLFYGGRLKSSYNEERLKESLRPLTGGLMLMHNRGLTHNDIQFRNILLTSTGGTKLLDFGTLHHMTPENPEPKYLAGTMRMFSPEQLRRQLLRKGLLKDESLLKIPEHLRDRERKHIGFKTTGSKKSDSWALGITAWGAIIKTDLYAPKEDSLSNLEKQYLEIYSREFEKEIDGIPDTKLSPLGKEWLKGMVKLDPTERFTMEQAHNHAFLREERSKSMLPTSTAKQVGETKCSLTSFSASPSRRPSDPTSQAPQVQKTGVPSTTTITPRPRLASPIPKSQSLPNKTKSSTSVTRPTETAMATSKLRVSSDTNVVPAKTVSRVSSTPTTQKPTSKVHNPATPTTTTKPTSPSRRAISPTRVKSRDGSSLASASSVTTKKTVIGKKGGSDTGVTSKNSTSTTSTNRKENILATASRKNKQVKKDDNVEPKSRHTSDSSQTPARRS